MTTSKDPPGMTCTDGWRITGYYIPVEGDFAGVVEKISVVGVGEVELPAKFLQATKMEGWGLVATGWYLGWSGGAWSKAKAALNAHGKPLELGSAATDRSVIPAGTSFRIASAPSPWNEQIFVADDTGGGIVGMHIDIYCGIGKQAEAETLRVTANNGRVCV